MNSRPRNGKRLAAGWALLVALAAVAVGPAALTSPRSRSNPLLGAKTAPVGGPVLTSPLVVHEWGTFVSMEGSDGVALEGLHHDEEDLPAFVHSRGKDQLRLRATRSKMETPVLYFYSPTRQRVHVRVDFPEGLLTQWFPQVSLAAPRLLQGDALPALRNGRLEWDVELIPEESPGSASTDPAAASALPRPGSNPLLGATTAPAGGPYPTSGRLSLSNTGTEPLRHLFLLRVEGDRGAYQYLPALAAGQRTTAQLPLDSDAVPLDRLVGRLRGALAERLTEQGLFPDEARAMVNTWSRSYFRTEGLRVLYVVPRSQVDRVLPLRIDPRPAELERVFVGRVECLTPEQEARIEAWLRDLATSESARAAAARDGLMSLGRFAEPHLRRALRSSSDPAVRARAQALLVTDALNELIAAEKAFPTDLDVTARLAALQRRAGRTREAKVRGQAALVRLQSSPAAVSGRVLSDHVARRKWLRSMAFAREAIGDPGPAADAYGEWVRFAATLDGKECQVCHREVQVPLLTFADLRDWWGGERFRAMAVAAGKTDALIARAEARLNASPSDPEALVTLAYLLPARGETAAADRLWQKLAARNSAARAAEASSSRGRRGG